MNPFDAGEGGFREQLVYRIRLAADRMMFVSVVMALNLLVVVGLAASLTDSERLELAQPIFSIFGFEPTLAAAPTHLAVYWAVYPLGVFLLREGARLLYRRLSERKAMEVN